MNVQILIGSIVRQTTVLIAELATSGDVRAPQQCGPVAEKVGAMLGDGGRSLTPDASAQTSCFAASFGPSVAGASDKMAFSWSGFVPYQ